MALSKIDAANFLTGIAPAANGGSGRNTTSGNIIQVVTGTSTYQKTTTSGSYVDVESSSGTAWETTITPSASSSKILITASVPANCYQSSSQKNQRGHVTLNGKIGSGSYAVLTGSDGIRIGSYDYSTGTSTGGVCSYAFLWSPSTTDACKVKFQMKVADGGNTSMAVNAMGSTMLSTVVLQEVSG